MKIRLSRKEALLYAATCDMYAGSDDPTFLEMNDRGELMMECEGGHFSIWHGLKNLDRRAQVFDFNDPGVALIPEAAEVRK